MIFTIGSRGGKDNQARVEELANVVTITVTTDDPAGGDDCADGLTVQLAGPLGERQINDAATDDNLLVHDACGP